MCPSKPVIECFQSIVSIFVPGWPFLNVRLWVGETVDNFMCCCDILQHRVGRSDHPHVCAYTHTATMNRALSIDNIIVNFRRQLTVREAVYCRETEFNSQNSTEENWSGQSISSLDRATHCLNSSRLVPWYASDSHAHRLSHKRCLRVLGFIRMNSTYLDAWTRLTTKEQCGMCSQLVDNIDYCGWLA